MSAAPPSTAAGDAPVLKLLNVESAYGPIKAIRGRQPEGAPGEIATVLGSNGAGKTTILKTISGIIDPRAVRSSSRARTSPPATRPSSCSAA
jgi:branched-chain amino acid transport system ATP-binding protein